MILFIAGLVAGTIFGFLIAGLMAAAGRDDR